NTCKIWIYDFQQDAERMEGRTEDSNVWKVRKRKNGTLSVRTGLVCEGKEGEQPYEGSISPAAFTRSR
ncbi:Hypothetical predicted protein, partial [Scomber scombrus]